MEPITTFLLTSAFVSMISGTYVFVLNSFGRKVIGSAVKHIKHRYQNIFVNRNIAILGDKGSGKTSLIYYLQNGKPLTIKNDQYHQAEPTVGSVVIDSSVKTYSKSDKEKRAKIIADVSGDKAFRLLWKELIEEIDPHGIIYMLDGRTEDKNIPNAIEPIFNDVFSYYTENINYKNINSHRLRAFHIFISFSDYWAVSRGVAMLKRTNVEMAFLKKFELPKYKHLQNVSVQISTMHLSPNKKEWRETDRALNLFGADLHHE